jgi:hypothetical protein
MDSDNVHQKPTQPLSGLAIAMIVLSSLAGIGLVFITYLITKRKKQLRNHHFFFFNRRKTPNSNPVSSSLDNSDMFFTILEFPPTQPQATLQSNSNINSKKMISTESTNGPVDLVSASLVRQSLEERSGYYKNPSRVPVPYYKHNPSINNTSKDCIMTSTTEEDEDTQEIQRWSNSSYQVW